METTTHTMGDLFEQLGLPSSQPAINRFIQQHQIEGASVSLHDASFWSPAQSAFLKDTLEADGEWSGVIDELNSRLHS